ncbi:MAG: 4-phosphoerythronate dehydrogenase [Bacteroidota bacterium]
MPAPLRLVVDANIPFAHDAFGRYGQVRALSGRDITRETVHDADVLLVRSVTPVDAGLLEGTPVRFIASATAGTDHIRLGDLRERGVTFAHAPGSNAASVVDWTVAALLHLAASRGEALEGRTLAVVGVGEVGGRLVPRAEALGMRVLRCDPPRAEAGHPGPWHDLADALTEADVLTLHTPLTREGQHTTHHLVGERELGAMREGAWLLNASRGPVVDGTALLRAVAVRRLGAVALDVWEGEPRPTPGLASRVDLGTPHIAGYAFDGKVRGTVMIEQALRAWLQRNGRPLPEAWNPEAALASPQPLTVTAPPPPETSTPEARARWLHALARQAYAITDDDRRFSEAVVAMPDPERRADAFTDLRRTYPVRREWSRYRVEGGVPTPLVRAVETGLGMRLV